MNKMIVKHNEAKKVNLYLNHTHCWCYEFLVSTKLGNGIHNTHCVLVSACVWLVKTLVCLLGMWWCTYVVASLAAVPRPGQRKLQPDCKAWVGEEKLYCVCVLICQHWFGLQPRLATHSRSSTSPVTAPLSERLHAVGEDRQFWQSQTYTRYKFMYI